MVGPGGRRSAVCWGQLPEVAGPLVLHLVLQLPEVAPVVAAAVLVAPVVVAASLVVAGSLLQVVAASLQVVLSVAPVWALP